MTGLSLSEMNAKVPGILNYISSISRQLGNFLLALGVLLMGIAAVPYRKGEKWAWYICWILPIILIVQLINSRGGLGWQADLIFLVVILGSLLLPYRKFFPNK
jgi:cell division protein FtsW (lipid II flippase)